MSRAPFDWPGRSQCRTPDAVLVLHLDCQVEWLVPQVGAVEDELAWIARMVARAIPTELDHSRQANHEDELLAGLERAGFVIAVKARLEPTTCFWPLAGMTTPFQETPGVALPSRRCLGLAHQAAEARADQEDELEWPAQSDCANSPSMLSYRPHASAWLSLAADRRVFRRLGARCLRSGSHHLRGRLLVALHRLVELRRLRPCVRYGPGVFRRAMRGGRLPG